MFPLVEETYQWELVAINMMEADNSEVEVRELALMEADNSEVEVRELALTKNCEHILCLLLAYQKHLFLQLSAAPCDVSTSHGISLFDSSQHDALS